MLESEFRYYLEHQAALAEKHDGKFLVIKDQKVIGTYDDEEEAIKTTSREHELGTFLVQKCSSDPDSVIYTYHSRVRLSGAEIHG